MCSRDDFPPYNDERVEIICIPVTGLSHVEVMERQRQVLTHWTLYGSVYLTNVDGLSLIDPKAVTVNVVADP